MTLTVVKNNSNTALTALSLSGMTRPFPPGPGFDSVVRIGGPASEIKPGGQYRISFQGVYPPGQIQLGAAILADGETFGDPAQIQAILARRRATSQALDIVIQGFPADAPGELMQVLRASQAAETKGVRDGALLTAIANVNLTIQRSAQAMTGEPSATILFQLANMLRQWKFDLTNSLPIL
jgi:hypothetical protein